MNSRHNGHGAAKYRKKRAQDARARNAVKEGWARAAQEAEKKLVIEPVIKKDPLVAELEAYRDVLGKQIDANKASTAVNTLYSCTVGLFYDDTPVKKAKAAFVDQLLGRYNSSYKQGKTLAQVLAGMMETDPKTYDQAIAGRNSKLKAILDKVPVQPKQEHMVSPS